MATDSPTSELIDAVIDRACLRAQGRAVREVLARNARDDGLVCVLRLVASATTHPVNNAVTVIQMANEVMSSLYRQDAKANESDIKASVEDIEHCAERIADRMRRLRKIAYILQDESPTDVSATLHAAIEAMTELGTRSLDVELPPGCVVRADPEVLLSALMRLLARATGEEKITGGSNICVRVAKAGETVVIEIEHPNERLFVPSGDKRDLKWIRSVFAEQRGDLEVLIAGERATFRITLPAHNAS